MRKVLRCQTIVWHWVLFEIIFLEKAWVVTGRHLGSVGSGRENRG